MFRLAQRSLKHRRFWQLLLACYWVALFIGTHIPIERLALNRGTADKFAHLAAFGGLALLSAITWRISNGRPLHWRQLFAIWLLVTLYGVIEETTQPLALRTASFIDWLADALGAALGLAIFWLLSERWLNKLAPDAEVIHDSNWPRAWRRYSLRTLFVAMTVVALACYWMMLPTMNAQQFVRALQQREYSTVESLFVIESEKFPGKRRINGSFEAHPTIQGLTWKDLLLGERRIAVITLCNNKNGDRITRGALIFAYRSGLVLHPLELFMPHSPNNSASAHGTRPNE